MEKIITLRNTLEREYGENSFSGIKSIRLNGMVNPVGFFIKKDSIRFFAFRLGGLFYLCEASEENIQNVLYENFPIAKRNIGHLWVDIDCVMKDCKNHEK